MSRRKAAQTGLHTFSVKQIIQIIGVAILIVGSVAGLLLQSNIWSGTSSSTVIADVKDPEINEAATSSGNLPATDQTPSLLCFVDESMQMNGVTAEIKRPGVGWELWTWMPLETLEMNYISKNGDIYKYKTQLPASLELNTEYKVIYTAVDASGRSDEYETYIQLIELAGTAWVNGIEVVSDDQEIYTQDLTITIEAEVNQDPEDIQKVQLLLDGTEVQVLEYRYSKMDYFASYKLPTEGKYELLVQILAEGGDQIRLASFSINADSSSNPVLLAGAAVAVLAVSGVLIYQQRKQEA